MKLEKLWPIAKAQTNQKIAWLSSPEGKHKLVYIGRKKYFLFAACEELFLIYITVFLQGMKKEWG